MIVSIYVHTWCSDMGADWIISYHSNIQYSNLPNITPCSWSIKSVISQIDIMIHHLWSLSRYSWILAHMVFRHSQIDIIIHHLWSLSRYIWILAHMVFRHGGWNRAEFNFNVRQIRSVIGSTVLVSYVHNQVKSWSTILSSYPLSLYQIHSDLGLILTRIR